MESHLPNLIKKEKLSFKKYLRTISFTSKLKTCLELPKEANDSANM